MEILYHDLVRASGQPADVVISALQKFIRRGETEQAARAAYELYLVGEEMTEYLWQRLKIISAEDIGRGQPVAPVVVEAVWSIRGGVPRDTSDYVYPRGAIPLRLPERARVQPAQQRDEAAHP